MQGYVTAAEHHRALQKIERLEEEVAELRSYQRAEHRAAEVVALRQAFGIYTCCSHVLLQLHRAAGAYVSVRSLNMKVPVARATLDEEPDPKRIPVMVKWLRKALGADAIETSYGYGFRLSEGGIRQVEAALRERQTRALEQARSA